LQSLGIQVIFHDLLCGNESNQEEDTAVPVGNCKRKLHTRPGDLWQWLFSVLHNSLFLPAAFVFWTELVTVSAVRGGGREEMYGLWGKRDGWKLW